MLLYSVCSWKILNFEDIFKKKKIKPLCMYVLCSRDFFISKFHRNKCRTFARHVNVHVKSKKSNLWNDSLHELQRVERFFQLIFDWKIKPTFGGGKKKWIGHVFLTLSCPSFVCVVRHLWAVVLQLQLRWRLKNPRLQITCTEITLMFRRIY